MLKKILCSLCIVMLLLTGCDPYPGEYVHYIHDFGPSDMDCHSFYHYTSVDNKLRQSGLQRYDLLTETDQDIFLSSTPDKEEVTSYWGDDNEVYFVVTTYQKGDDDLVLYYYDLKSDVCEKILENNKYLLVFRNSNTNRTIVKTDSQRFYIEDGILHEIEESDIIKSDFSSKEDVVRRVNADGTVVEICKELDSSKYTLKVDGSSYYITALPDFGVAESGLTNNFVTEGDTIVGIVQITRGTNGLPPGNFIRERQLKKELLVSINYKTGDSEILFNTKNNKTRIIGYSNGNIYLLKDGKIICQNLSDNSEKEIYTLTYDGDKQLSFSWVGSRLIIFDEYNLQVIANIQT